MKNTILALSILASFSALASDDEIKSKKNDTYVSFSVGAQESSLIDLYANAYGRNNVDDSATAFKLASGKKFNENAGIEFKLQYANYEGSILGNSAEMSFLNYGGYFVGYVPLDDFNFFAKTGFVATFTNQKHGSYKNKDTSFGMSYGFGMDYSINDDWKVVVEYSIDDADFDGEAIKLDNRLTTMSIGVARYF